MPIQRALPPAFHVLCFVAASVLAGDPNWLANPGFETASEGGPAFWALGMEGRGEGEPVWQKGGAHGGQRCLRVALTTPGDYCLGRQGLTRRAGPGLLCQIRRVA